MKHTKGKWEYNGKRIMSNEICIATIHDIGGEYTPTIKEAKANAKLIAAAPELLEALDWIQHHALQDGCNKLALKTVALAAIKKATP